ncbi:uncharacterized protein METZ01_LOCUS267424, partial [marine metagenome]
WGSPRQGGWPLAKSPPDPSRTCSA